VRYQLVLQFTADTIAEFDQFVALEEKLVEALEDSAIVDGHDFGQSEFNIFVLTNEPAMVFDKAHRIIRDQRLQQGMRAAYREPPGESFMILWPTTLTEYSVI
jgi:hypothetical protein